MNPATFVAARSSALPPARVRELLEGLGPTWIKIGQFLALRPDLIAQEYCDELLRLSDDVAPVPFAEIDAVLARDLGAGSTELFEWINPRPLAAASLAQVHTARTWEGDEVAVKVRRPGIEAAVERDLASARRLASLLEALGLAAPVSPREVVDELASWLAAELDFERERANLERFRELAADHPTLRVPRPYPELCGAEVVTSELLVGVPFSELLGRVRSGRRDPVDSLGFDRDELARRLLEAILTQIFEFRLFHADTHPGNLLALQGERIGFVDFGLVEPLDPTFHRGMVGYLAAVYSQDVEAMYHGLRELLVPGEGADLQGFREDFFAESRVWLRDHQTVARHARPERSPISRYLVGVLRAARRNRMRIPRGLLALYRSLLTAETVAHQLGGEADLASVGRGFFRRLELRWFLDALRWRNNEPVLRDVVALLQEAPGALRQLVADTLAGRFVLQVQSREAEEDRRQADDRARLLAASVVSVSLALLVVAVRGTAWGPVSAVWPTATLLALSWLAVAILWRRLG